MIRWMWLALLALPLAALDLDDVDQMRYAGVKISFPGERTAHAILAKMKPAQVIKADYLGFNGAPLYFIPDWLPQMTALVRLDLQRTKITLKDLEKLVPLKRLSILDLRDNALFKKTGTLSLTQILTNFDLNELYLSNTGGHSGSYGAIGSLDGLIRLDLSGNRIENIEPLKLSSLRHLKYLNLSDNHLDSINVDALPRHSLVTLDIAQNNLDRFPFAGDFPALESLDLSQNKRYMRFDERYGSIFLFKHLVQLKINDDVKIPQGLREKLRRYVNFIEPHYTHNANGLMWQDNLDVGRERRSWGDAMALLPEAVFSGI